MPSAGERHLARLLGYPPGATPSVEELAAGAAGNVQQVTKALVAEALASDDVASGADARSFIQERLDELGDLLKEALRAELVRGAEAEIQRRAPEG